MVSKEPLRVRVTTDREAVEAMEAVEADGVPRVIERDGHAIAMVVSVEGGEGATPSDFKPTREDIELTLATAGSWKDLEGLDDLVETIYRWRRESPPSEPVEF